MFQQNRSFYTATFELHLYYKKFLFSIRRHIINAFLLIYQMGTCCVYIVFISRNLQSVSISTIFNSYTERMVLLKYLKI